MATFRERDGKFHVLIRKKGQSIGKAFSDKETTELYAKYKEDLIDEMEAFDVQRSKMITLESAIDLKIEQMKNDERDDKTISDIAILKKEFHDYLDLPINELKYDMLKQRANEMLVAVVLRGGSLKTHSGRKCIQSPVTVRKKFASLSSVISHLNKLGIDCENNAFRLLGFLNKIITDSKTEQEYEE